MRSCHGRAKGSGLVMKHIGWLAGILALLGAITAANAGTMNGERLTPLCRLAKASVAGTQVGTQMTWTQAGECLGFIEGVLDATTSYPQASTHICFPNGSMSGTLIEIVTDYLDKHPENRHFSATSLVITALQEAFPCRN